MGTIISVAELARTRADDRAQTAKLSMQAFLTQLKNAGLNIDYSSFKEIYDANPELANSIQEFNDTEIVFVDVDSEEDSGLSAPSGNVPPEKKVSQMAKAALAKRQ